MSALFQGLQSGDAVFSLSLSLGSSARIWVVRIKWKAGICVAISSYRNSFEKYTCRLKVGEMFQVL